MQAEGKGDGDEPGEWKKDGRQWWEELSNMHVGFEAKIWKTNSKLGDFSSVALANFESPQGSLMGLTESAGAHWMVSSRKDLVKALPPLKIKVPGTAAGGRAKKIAKK
ncbi:hypothetical protein K438DRAFT_1752972 [Mycena galopus ATCC 62051]|nr:hypothetical protein K438DRAFT_1752972 [Mycena galopus ATCC 62051]